MLWGNVTMTYICVCCYFGDSTKAMPRATWTFYLFVFVPYEANSLLLKLIETLKNSYCSMQRLILPFYVFNVYFQTNNLAGSGQTGLLALNKTIPNALYLSMILSTLFDAPFFSPIIFVGHL